MPRKTRKLTNEEKEIVLNLLDTKTRKEIAETIKVNYSSLKLFLDEQRIPIKKQGIPFEYYENIFELYKSGLTLQTIHNDYFPQYTTDQINYICREAKITRKNGRQAILNHNYFSIIDTPNKAYWLGFIAADGCVLEPTYQVSKRTGKIIRKEQGALQIGLQEKDKTHLEKFQKDIKEPGQIVFQRFIPVFYIFQLEISLTASLPIQKYRHHFQAPQARSVYLCMQGSSIFHMPSSLHRSAAFRLLTHRRR